MTPPDSAARRAAAALVAALLALPAAAQTYPLPTLDVPLRHDTGPLVNAGDEPALLDAFEVRVPGVAWMQLDFGQLELGDPLSEGGAWLRIVSQHDGYEQRLDARSARQWRGRSAYFNGDAVIVEVYVPPGERPTRVAVDGATVAGPLPASQCGATDDRVLSSDPRVARVMPVVCTGWMIDDCARCFLTAGHCSSGTSSVQFNVPLSTSGGQNQHPPPSDQYSVDSQSMQSNGGQGVGDDWAYFGVFPNSTTGLLPHEVQGATFVLSAPPSFASGQELRITGHGADSTPLSHDNVQQTHTGLRVFAGGQTLSYVVDTEGGNSGSPVIHEATGHAIGIHTHGGCSTSGTGNNNGTASTHPDLQGALLAPRGVCEAGLGLAAPLPAAVAPGVGTPVVVEARGTVVPGTPTLHVRYGGSGPFTPQPLARVGGDSYEGVLSPAACGQDAEYWFSATFEACGTLALPPAGAAEPFRAAVGSAVTVVVDDFETDLGWSVQNSPGLTDGAWTRGVPVDDQRGDPAFDGDGSGQCWLTDNEAGNSDVDGGTTHLISPPYDLPSGGVVSWRYWLNDIPTGPLGSEDSFQVAVATDPAGKSWQTVRTYTTAAGEWRMDTLLVGVETPASATLRLRFSVSDLSPGDVVEGGLDALRVDRVECDAAGVSFCAGDGLGTPCPCLPGLVGHGCENSFSTGGGLLEGFGTPSVAADGVQLRATGLPFTTPALFFQGDAEVAAGAGAAFGDGLRCAGGTVVRLGTRMAALGLVELGAGVPGDSAVSTLGAVPAGGGTRLYQVWYRNTEPYCTADGFNLSNGYRIDWLP